MKQTISLIFPHQLYKHNPLIKKNKTIVLIEEPRFFTDFTFHKQKLVLHRASMKFYEDFLATKYRVRYIPFPQATFFYASLAQENIQEVDIIDPIDYELEEKLKDVCKKQKIKLNIQENHGFLTANKELDTFFAHKERFLMASFYIRQRKNLGILVDAHNKPLGGSWSFDKDNRKPLPKNSTIPRFYTPKHNSFVKEAIKYVNVHFAQNPGNADDFWFATTFQEAEQAFEDFLENRLYHFGDYEDAISTTDSILFHSVLSPMLNCGLITPDVVVHKALAYAQKQTISLNNLEGFIRQIIGWREFVRGVYRAIGKEQKQENFWHHTTTLSPKFWEGNTGIDPIDITINNVINNAYAHHIERLMILGNFMLLCQINPNDVYKWFMEFFIDAYDWVMVPNVYGMSQYADGGKMITKPYISSSHYIRTMSNFSKGAWCDIWDSLYWNFIAQNQTIIEKNARLKIMSFYLKRMNKRTLEEHKKRARNFLKTLHE